MVEGFSFLNVVTQFGLNVFGCSILFYSWVKLFISWTGSLLIFFPSVCYEKPFGVMKLDWQLIRALIVTKLI